MSTPKLADALQKAECLYTSAQIRQSIAETGSKLALELNGVTPVFLTIMHGGLMYAAQLALATPADMEFDYLHATRYRGDTSGGQLHWLHKPKTPLAGRVVVLADDILDEGNTLSAVREYCVEQGASRVIIAVMTSKYHGRRVAGLEADYPGLALPDRYIFGYGMDYHEQGRNLPAIYAL